MPDDEKTVSDQDDRTPFRRFEDFARRIIAVPKHEIDDARQSPAPEDDPPIDPDWEKRGPGH
jgi:hypothetical protein